MELTIAQLDPGLTPTCALLGAAYKVLLDLGGDTLDEALGEFDATTDDLARVARRCCGLLQFQADTTASFDALLVMAHLVGTWGRRSGARRASFELEVKREAAGLSIAKQALYVPFWVPAVAGLNGRDLLFPIVATTRSRALHAYEGLVQHLRTLPDDASEVAVTAVLWRIAALSDGLAANQGGTLARLNVLRSQVTQDPSVSELEKRLWDPLTSRFVHSRDALTHMTCERDGVLKEVFEGAVAYALTERDTFIPAATALGFAVLQDIGLHLAELDAPLSAWERVLGEHGWVDDQL